MSFRSRHQRAVSATGTDDECGTVWLWGTMDRNGSGGRLERAVADRCLLWPEGNFLGLQGRNVSECGACSQGEDARKEDRTQDDV